MNRRPAIAALTLLAAACAPPPQSGPVGRIYHYLRTNTDGSLPEHIHVFRESPTRLEVYKMVEKCTNAALVTADLDLERGFAPRLTGGRLRPGAEHAEFAFLQYDDETGVIDMRVELPDGVLTERLAAGAPFHLYDFDLADVTVFGRGLVKDRANFTFDLLLLWPPAEGNKMLHLGRADFRFSGEETRGGTTALRYEAAGPAFGDKGGPIWFDKKEGHIVDVEWKIPNHAEYRDFKLALIGVDDGGASAWKKLLTEHYDGCEAS